MVITRLVKTITHDNNETHDYDDDDDDGGDDNSDDDHAAMMAMATMMMMMFCALTKPMCASVRACV